MAGNPFTDPNWAADIADTIERVVGTVRDRTTKPLVTASRGLVFGLLAAILGVVALTLLIIAASRGIAGAARHLVQPHGVGVCQLPDRRGNLLPRRAVRSE